jgi:hypothetical protein
MVLRAHPGWVLTERMVWARMGPQAHPASALTALQE